MKRKGDHHDPGRIEGRSRVLAGAVRNTYPAGQEAEAEIAARISVEPDARFVPIARACLRSLIARGHNFTSIAWNLQSGCYSGTLALGTLSQATTIPDIRISTSPSEPVADASGLPKITNDSLINSIAAERAADAMHLSTWSLLMAERHFCFRATNQAAPGTPYSNKRSQGKIWPSSFSCPAASGQHVPTSSEFHRCMTQNFHDTSRSLA